VDNIEPDKGKRRKKTIEIRRSIDRAMMIMTSNTKNSEIEILNQTKIK
jgi:hypothetical protein